MGLFTKKVHLDPRQERALLALSKHWSRPFDHLVKEAIDNYIDQELRKLPKPTPPKLTPPSAPKCRTVYDSDKKATREEDH